MVKVLIWLDSEQGPCPVVQRWTDGHSARQAHADDPDCLGVQPDGAPLPQAVAEWYFTHNHVRIRGAQILQSTAVRDWICECGNRLKSQWTEEAPHWRVVCAKNSQHYPDQFHDQRTYLYLKNRSLLERAEAEDVLKRLPKEMQAAILDNSREEK